MVRGSGEDGDGYFLLFLSLSPQLLCGGLNEDSNGAGLLGNEDHCVRLVVATGGDGVGDQVLLPGSLQESVA